MANTHLEKLGFPCAGFLTFQPSVTPLDLSQVTKGLTFKLRSLSDTLPKQSLSSLHTHLCLYAEHCSISFVFSLTFSTSAFFFKVLRYSGD